MKRRLLNLLTAVSLLLCAAVVVLWVLSCWRFVELKGPVAGRSARLSLLPHALWVEWTDRPYYQRSVRGKPQAYGVGQFRDFFRLRVEPPPVMDRSLGGWRPRLLTQIGSESYFVLGFGYRPPRFQRGRPCTFTSVGVPFWSPATTSFLLPASWLWSKRRALRRCPPGHCPACGYDLRATPGRCPECGREASQNTGSPSTSPQATVPPRA